MKSLKTKAKIQFKHFAAVYCGGGGGLDSSLSVI